MARRKGHNAGGNGRESMAPLIEAAERAGWTVERSGSGHLKFRSPSGAMVTGPLTPSDGRSWLNVRSKLRRAGLEC